MFITWFLILAIITGVILYYDRDSMRKASDWAMGIFVCIFCIGIICLFVYGIGSEIATNSCKLECTTTTIGAIADTDDAVIITRDDGGTEITIATYDVSGKISMTELDYDDCLIENSTKNIVEKHEYTFVNKITKIFFRYSNDSEYTIKTTDTHIIDGTRIG